MRKMHGKEELKDKITALPMSPGVYLFKDAGGRIIYIGKAKLLKKRVQSYFNRPLDVKTQALVSRIADIDYLTSVSDVQARLLEAALIRQKQPIYNIDLKDDKTFPWIKITHEDFPLVNIYRKRDKDGSDESLYFGPYINAKMLRKAVKVIRQVFGFRSCKKMPKKPCLYNRLKLCPAPCAGKISRKDYQDIIEEIRMFFESRHQDLLNRLGEKMQDRSRKREYEEASRIKDQIDALSVLRQSGTESRSHDELLDLKLFLKLSRIPLRIEAFDISNISGQEATGSMVSFYRGFPDKSNYRRFRIKTVLKIDDYAMIREIVRRRYLRLKEEAGSLPDLVLIDGGRAHLSAAKEELRKLNIDLPLMSIAKDKENIYLNNNVAPLKLNQETPALNLIRRIRDEAHRFALKYHHLLRRKKILGNK
ncbi:MAG: excinuclease ABC subunit UvrC [Candidatus Omnitrophota bacterium]|nr:excinuclease ABC subunit UvrC [Candidatus Omnitrophota bacterium]